MDDTCNGMETFGHVIDLNQTELLTILARLQGELDARDILITTLRSELNNSICANAKCHRYFLNEGACIEPSDAIFALQRDRKLCTDDNNFSSGAFDSNKYEICELIENRRRIHEFYKEKIQLAEDKYLKLSNLIAAERYRHGEDKLQSSKVLSNLEAENKILKFELEATKTRNEKLEQCLLISQQKYDELKLVTQKQRIVAANLIKERRIFQQKLDSTSQPSEGCAKNPNLQSPDFQIDVSSESTDVNESNNLIDISSSVRPSNEIDSSIRPGTLESLSIQVDIASTPSKVITSFADYEHRLGTDDRICSTPPIAIPICFESDMVMSNLIDTSTNLSDEGPSPFFPTKLRPEPPIRRTPEYASLPANGSTAFPYSVFPVTKPVLENSDSRDKMKLIPSPYLEKTTQALSLDCEKHSIDGSRPSTPSPPPPPPPPMQLHYPYPGMHGNTCHPPLLTLSPNSRNIGSVITSPHYFPVSPPRANNSRSPPVQQLFQNLSKVSTGASKTHDTVYSGSHLSSERNPIVGSQKFASHISSMPISMNTNTSPCQNNLVSLDLNYSVDSIMPNDLSHLLSSSFNHLPTLSIPSIRPPVPTVNYHVKENHSSLSTSLSFSPRGVVTTRNFPSIPSGHLYINGK